MKRLTLQKLLLAALTPFTLNVFAKEEGMNFQTILNAIKTAKVIKINVINPFTFVYGGIDENYLKTNGANYIFYDAVDVVKVVDILLLSKPIVAEPFFTDGTPIMAIYFVLQNKQEIKFLINGKYFDKDLLLYGKYGNLNDVKMNFFSVEENVIFNIYKYLYDWESIHPSSENKIGHRSWLSFLISKFSK